MNVLVKGISPGMLPHRIAMTTAHKAIPGMYQKTNVSLTVKFLLQLVEKRGLQMSASAKMDSPGI